MNKKQCVICGGYIVGYKANAFKEGNNAEPLAKGACCDRCNYEKVIPFRLNYDFENNHKELQKELDECESRNFTEWRLKDNDE